MRFASEKDLEKDQRLYDESRYQKIYTWLYFSHKHSGYMCKLCDVYFGDNPVSSGGSRGAFSHRGVVFGDNPGKRLRRHVASRQHKEAVSAMANLRINEALDKANDETRGAKEQANKLYVSKLISIVHFLARNNLAVKFLYPKFIDFLANELEEPIMKQYLETCPKNATYTSHETCDSLISALNEYFRKDTEERLKRATDLVLFADESMSSARKEMLGVFISSFDDNTKQFHLDFFSMVHVSSTKSEVLMNTIEKLLRERSIDIKKTKFCCLDGTNSMSGEQSGLQRRIRNHAPHAIYINCRCHRLALCFKHVMSEFKWLQKIDGLLLGLWKTFHYSGVNRVILKELQEAYGMKPLQLVKAVVTRWLSHGAACQRCRERYVPIIEALDGIICTTQRADIIGYRSEMLKPRTVFEITFLEDVLSVTNILSLVLQSDHKDFGSIIRATEATIQALKKMRESVDSLHLKSFRESVDIIEQIESFERRNVLSHSTRKRSLVDNEISMQDFHKKVAKPFLSALDEINAAFDLSCVGPVEALLAVDPASIPDSSDVNFKSYGEQDLKKSFDFYGKAVTDVFQGHTNFSPAILSCTTPECLLLEYGGYKTYIDTQKKNILVDYGKQKRNIESRLLLVNAQKYKTHHAVKKLEEELNNIEEKLRSPIKVEDMLRDRVVEAAFPNIRRLLKIFILIPMSDAVTERGFSKMKLIMNERRTRLDDKSLEALMRLSYHSSKLSHEEINNIIGIWKSKKDRRIFSEDI